MLKIGLVDCPGMIKEDLLQHHELFPAVIDAISLVRQQDDIFPKFPYFRSALGKKFDLQAQCCDQHCVDQIGTVQMTFQQVLV